MSKSLTLSKAGHRYVFRYGAGYEREVLEQVEALADQGAIGWLEAAELGCCLVADVAAASRGAACRPPAGLETERGHSPGLGGT